MTHRAFVPTLYLVFTEKGEMGSLKSPLAKHSENSKPFADVDISLPEGGCGCSAAFAPMMGCW